MPNLKEVIFVKAKDNKLYNNLESGGLTIYNFAIRNNPNLTKIHILSNLKVLDGVIFYECTNTDILIEALQSSVNVSSTVKSVTWLNG